jgi:lipopolysaccharide biosynthesis glycosyltransferase
MTDKRCSIWIGFDERETAAFAVARHSAKRRMALRYPIRGIVLDDLIGKGLYKREVQERPGPAGNKVLWDPISDAPMSTQFAISRFFAPLLAQTGWALFMDCDVLVRISLTRLFEELDDKYAVYCVKHPEMPDASGVKMDAQIQTAYRRKLWSSVMAFNVDHPANKALTLELLNTVPGRELHRFFWLNDYEIGELGPEWNYLVGISQPPAVTPRIAHFTMGTPNMDGHAGCEFADEWWHELTQWAGVA